MALFVADQPAPCWRAFHITWPFNAASHSVVCVRRDRRGSGVFTHRRRAPGSPRPRMILAALRLSGRDAGGAPDGGQLTGPRLGPLTPAELDAPPGHGERARALRRAGAL